MGKIYMIGSQKGGTAKTTTTFNLAYCLRKMGKRVLAVDFDSQANLTTCFGVEDTGVLDDTIGHLMMAQIEDMKLPSPKKYIRTKDGVDVIPALCTSLQKYLFFHCRFIAALVSMAEHPFFGC